MHDHYIIAEDPQPTSFNRCIHPKFKEQFSNISDSLLEIYKLNDNNSSVNLNHQIFTTLTSKINPKTEELPVIKSRSKFDTYQISVHNSEQFAYSAGSRDACTIKKVKDGCGFQEKKKIESSLLQTTINLKKFFLEQYEKTANNQTAEFEGKGKRLRQQSQKRLICQERSTPEMNIKRTTQSPKSLVYQFPSRDTSQQKQSFLSSTYIQKSSQLIEQKQKASPERQQNEEKVSKSSMKTWIQKTNQLDKEIFMKKKSFKE